MAETNKDVFIMDTNNSSIVSKRSVERLYYHNEPHYFRYFVDKVKRRAPVINRGYWLRMRAIEHTIEEFLSEPSSKQKIVINLGCGSDPLPWLMLGKQASLCQNAKFIDVDYPPLMHRKLEIIRNQPPLHSLLPGLAYTTAKTGVLCDSAQYAAVGCDLYNLDFLSYVLREQLDLESCSIAILLVAEVSTAYMELEGSQAVFRWAASYSDVKFCLLEQHLPAGRDHPFAQTMLKHFQKLRTPLNAIGAMQEMHDRFVKAGWPDEGIDIRSLWRLWSDPTFLTDEQRRKLDFVEPFDEWEEYALFASHYFLLVARKGCEMPDPVKTDSQELPPVGPDVDCLQLEAPHTQRRFAALVTPSAGSTAIGLHGGLGKTERLADMDIFTLEQAGEIFSQPPTREGLMCHTITTLHDSSCLLVGGRASPDKAFSDCWLRGGETWSKIHNLPQPRYRHCSTAYSLLDGTTGVIVFGGKSDASTICSEVVAWDKCRGWTILRITGDMPQPRFGAAAILVGDSQSSGILLGGMSDNGTICQDVFLWSLQANDTIDFQDVTSKYLTMLGSRSKSLHRFGAQLVRWLVNGEHRNILLGGVSHGDLLTRDNELLDLTTCTNMPLTGVYPLLTGSSIQDRTCIGGGATCFSFGTFWNLSYQFQLANEQHQCPWRLQSALPPKTSKVRTQQERPLANKNDAVQEVPVIQLAGAKQFEDILQAGRPAIFRGCNIGQCTEKWTSEYLKTTLGSRKVVVHSAQSTKMDFQNKNFRYETKTFDELIDDIQAGGLVYLRALSTQAPSEMPTNLAADFPEIAADFQLPPELEFVTAHAHSTPLRVSGRTIMWLHYDVMSNVLCQICGHKTLLLYPPQDIVNLGVEAGMSSSSVDVFDQTATTIAGCHPHEARLQPGDILFIPSLWLHSAAPTDGMSIAINVFFRHLRAGYSAGRDVYGNRDFAAYERGRRDVAKIAKSFSNLPSDITEAYIERLIVELRTLSKTR